MGRMKAGREIDVVVFCLVVGYVDDNLPFTESTMQFVALLGICVLLLCGVLSWEDIISERGAWDVFIWYGGLVRMAEALAKPESPNVLRKLLRGLQSGWKWWLALARAVVDLLLRSLRVCEHYSPRHRDVHALPGCDSRCRSTALPGGAVAGLLFQS